MEQAPRFVGIDVAKAKVDVAVRPTDDKWEVPNDNAGIRQLVSRLRLLNRPYCCLRHRADWSCLWWLRWQPRRRP